MGSNATALELIVSTQTVTAGWINPGGGSWQTPGNWQGGVVPNGNTMTAILGIAILAPSTITLDDPSGVTLGNLFFSNTNSYMVTPGIGANTASFFNLNNGPGESTISDLLGVHTITAPIVMNNGMVVTVSNPTDVLTLKGPISGNGGVDLFSGSGTLVLSGNQTNSYTGATTIASPTGTIQIGDGSTFGGLPNTLGVADNGTLAFDQPAGTTTIFANTISGTGGLDQIGTGSTLLLTGSTSYTGLTVVVSNATLRIG